MVEGDDKLHTPAAPAALNARFQTEPAAAFCHLQTFQSLFQPKPVINCERLRINYDLIQLE